MSFNRLIQREVNGQCSGHASNGDRSQVCCPVRDKLKQLA